MPAHKPADEAAVREQAYYFWEQDGRPHGRETEYWARAAVAVAEKSQMDTLTKGPPKKTIKAAAKPAAKPKAAPKLKAAANTAKAAPSKSGKSDGKAKTDAKAKPKKK